MSLDLSTLNETQLQAVQWDDGPLLVLAGPGSGKTRVLTFRISRIVEQTPDQSFRILGLTFTNKAAAEMRERIETLVPNSGNRILLSTFHSFAGDILRQHGHLIGLRPDFAILSQDMERADVLDEAITVSGLHDEFGGAGERLLPAITRLLDHAADESAALSLLTAVNANQPEDITKIYLTYRQQMIAHNSLDFGCLIAEALRLVKEKPAVRRQIHRVYKYIAVDEFQDTNQSQYELLSLITNHDIRNLFVVADDDQMIYEWNGASPERLVALREKFKMNVVQLPENYRCPPAIIEIANKLIAHNIGRSPDKEALRARKQAIQKNPVRLQSFDTFDDEAEWIASDIAALDSETRSRCVILARARRSLDDIHSKLIERGVPAYIAARKDDWTSAPLRLLHACLRLANSRQDRNQLRRLCKSFYAIEGINLSVNDIVSAAATYEGDYLRAFAIVALRRSELEPKTRRFLERSIPKLADRLDYDALIAESFAWSDKMAEQQAGTEEYFADYPEEKQTWHQLVAEIGEQYGADNVSLHLLLQEMDLRSKAPKPPLGAVPCQTIHASKGLEFNHVYLAGLVEDQLPSWAAVKKGDESREMQEERRNCFVAITRTEETLTLTYSQMVRGWSKEPSRFLIEMGLLRP